MKPIVKNLSALAVLTGELKRRFIVHYLDKQLRSMAKDGHSLPICAESPEQAVTFCFGMPADRWDGNHFWKWTDMPDGGLKCRIEEVTS